MNKHPQYQLPEDPHARHRYEKAMRHVEAAKNKGGSSAEIHELFQRIMQADPFDIERIPTDDAHAVYRSAMIHVKKAKERGASASELHAMYRRIMDGTAKGHSIKQG